MGNWGDTKCCKREKLRFRGRSKERRDDRWV